MVDFWSGRDGTVNRDDVWRRMLSQGRYSKGLLTWVGLKLTQ